MVRAPVYTLARAEPTTCRIVAIVTAVISIGINPEIHLGPITLAWHGLTIAIGILAGGVLAKREARRRGLDPEPINTLGLILIVGAIVGSRAFYLAEHGGLSDPAAWVGNRGFTFYGGFLLAGIGIVVYARRQRLDIVYLDLVSLGLPLGYAIGRVGDIINGEHYGPPTTFFLGVKNTNPGADVPRHDIAYHNGGLYESMIGLAVFALAWSLRNRLPRGTLVWVVMGALALGRFVEFFARSDSDKVALGLETAQWVSLALIAVAVAGAWSTHRRLTPRG